MGRPSGFPKSGGRTLGTPNKSTAQGLEAFLAADINSLSEIQRLLPLLKPEQQVNVHLKLLEFQMPKIKVSMNAELKLREKELFPTLTAEDREASLKKIREIDKRFLPTNS